MLLSKNSIEKFRQHLVEEEKSAATLEKYIRDVTAFFKWLSGQSIEKTTVLDYKRHLSERYSPVSVNSMLSSLNSFFCFYGRYDLKVKSLKIQKHIFSSEEKLLTKSEYERLLKAAKLKGNDRLHLLLQTICSCGLRVSELKFITVETVKKQQTEIKSKGKIRQIFLPGNLCKALIKYAQKRGIKTGAIFITKSGKALDRSNIWSDMKKLCKTAGIAGEKVFPHNLRHLFARTFYAVKKDIVRLADVLGHSSINTTRIYTMESGESHRKQIQKLGLVPLLY